MNERHILVVDDEQDLCEILKFNLELEGYIVDTANSAEEADEMIRNQGADSFQLLLLDVMMGGMSGFAFARKLKQDPATEHLPIIFLTAKDTENDTITGLNIGADDYISKPFSLRECIARVKAVIRRTSSEDDGEPEVISYKGLVINTEQKTLTVDGEAVPLTRTEYSLLALLMTEQGRVFSRQQLIDRIWPKDVLVLDRTVDVNITRLRKKLGQYSHNLRTRQGFGYFFEP